MPEKKKKPSKKKKPKFSPMNLTTRIRVKDRWRKPRGVANKRRRKCAYVGPSPRVGYKNAEEARHLHPLGLPEFLVKTPTELDGAKDVLVRIAGSVGAKKRTLIEEKAKKLGLRVLN